MVCDPYTWIICAFIYSACFIAFAGYIWFTTTLLLILKIMAQIFIIDAKYYNTVIHYSLGIGYMWTNLMVITYWIIFTIVLLIIVFFMSYHIFIFCHNIGHIDISKKIYNLGLIIVPIYTIFNNCCRDGHLEMVKWLYSMCHNNNNTHYQKCANAIEICCQFGHLNIIKWIYDVTDGNVKFKCNSFIICCENGHLNIAKWLHNIKKTNSCTNVNFDIEYAIDSANQKRRMNVIKWLLSLTDTDMITDKNNNDLNCLICYDKCNIQLKCGHMYCRKCLLKWIRYKEKKCCYCFKNFKFSESKYFT